MHGCTGKKGKGGMKMDRLGLNGPTDGSMGGWVVSGGWVDENWNRHRLFFEMERKIERSEKGTIVRKWRIVEERRGG